MKKVINLDQRPSATGILMQFLISMGITLLSTIGITFLGVLVATLVTGRPVSSFSMADYSQADNTIINGIKIVQFFSTIGVFLLPAIILPRMLFKVQPLQYTGFTARSAFYFFILAVLIYFAFMPLLDLSIRLNQEMQLPSSLDWLQKWMRESEDTNGLITKRFLEMPDTMAFLINVLILAILPAIAEEFFFRGFVQRTLYIWWQNKHVAVWVTAAFFSFIHFQFFGFVPRMLLGVLLGYLFIWSGNLKLPILVHFVNNFTSVVAAYLMQRRGEEVNIDAPNDYPGMAYILSAIFGAALLYLFYKLSRKRKASRDEVTTPEGRTGQWVRLLSSPEAYKVEIAAGNLEAQGILSVIMNKKNSYHHGTYGEIELYVHEEDLERARQLIPSYKI